MGKPNLSLDGDGGGAQSTDMPGIINAVTPPPNPRRSALDASNVCLVGENPTSSVPAR